MDRNRLLNMIEEHMVHSPDTALMRRRDEKHGVLMVVYAMTPHEFLAQSLKAIYTFSGIEAPDTFFAFLASQGVQIMQRVQAGDMTRLFQLVDDMAAAEASGDGDRLRELAETLQEVWE